MNIVSQFFDINSVFFTVFDYPMSYLEFFGTILTIWCVWLTSKAKILSWPVGIAGSLLYLFLFYQIQLYSDLMEQVYFIVTGIIGWYMWVRYKKEQESDHATVIPSVNSTKENLIWVGVIVLGTAVLTYFTMNFNNWWPQYFPEPVSYPMLDALTTVMSFVAQFLLMKKKAESWILWIIVDAIGIGLYWVKGVKFLSLEYLLFFFIASYGLYNWLKIYRKHHVKKS